MSLFEYISVAISIILALGVARLLTSMIELARHRRKVKWHWVPIVWALAILIIQFQFWWQVFAVDSVLESLGREWRNIDYIVMVLYTITLFTAGSLILPSRYESDDSLDLWRHFHTEGKLALVALIGYVICGMLLMLIVLGVPLRSLQAGTYLLLNVVWAAPMLGTLLSRGKTAVSFWTMIFAVLGIGVWYLTVVNQH